MLQASMKPDVPSPQNGGNRHRPLSLTSDVAPPPVPPRTYSQRGHMNGGPAGHTRHHAPHSPVTKPMRKYQLEEFQFLKLLGKGSFGKVSGLHTHTHVLTTHACTHSSCQTVGKWHEMHCRMPLSHGLTTIL